MYVKLNIVLYLKIRQLTIKSVCWLEELNSKIPVKESVHLLDL